MGRIGDTSELEGGAVFFQAVVRGERRDCFAVRHAGGLSAFVNVCAHRNQPVVVEAAHPFDDRGRIECRAHGAMYDPFSGECVEGPCQGARLTSVPLEIRDGEVLAIDDDVVDDSIYASLDDGF